MIKWLDQVCGTWKIVKSFSMLKRGIQQSPNISVSIDPSSFLGGKKNVGVLCIYRLLEGGLSVLQRSGSLTINLGRRQQHRWRKREREKVCVFGRKGERERGRGRDKGEEITRSSPLSHQRAAFLFDIYSFVGTNRRGKNRATVFASVLANSPLQMKIFMILFASMMYDEIFVVRYPRSVSMSRWSLTRRLTYTLRIWDI